MHGEVDALVPERVWQEFSRALGEANPERFFMVLRDTLILPRLFPNIDKYWEKTQSALIKCVKLTRDPVVRFAAMLFNFVDLNEIKDLCNKFKIPREYKELAILANRLKPQLAKLLNQIPKDYLIILENMDSYRRPERLEKLILVAMANDIIAKITADKLRQTHNLTKSVKLTPDIIAKHKPQELCQALHDVRIAALP